MKKCFTLLLFVFASLIALGQQYQDVVYLKNGSVIRGTIVEQVPNVSIKIESAGNTFVFKLDEIEKMTKETAPVNKKDREPKVREESALQKGYQGIVEIGMAVTYGEEITGANETLKLNLINGYRFNPFLAFGVGAGARFLMHDDKSILTPLFADMRINMINRKSSPYISLALGHMYTASNDFASFGTFFGFGVGATIKVAAKNSLNVGFSYEAVGSSDHDHYLSDVFSGDYRSFGFNFGFNF